MNLTPAVRALLAKPGVTVGPGVKLPISEFRNTEITAVLPLPPSTNNLFLSVGRRRVRTREYREWAAVAAGLLAGMSPVTAERFAVVITVVGGRGLNPARDLDNFAKPTLDALVAAGVLRGDSIRDGLHDVRVNYAPGDGEQAGVRVEVRTLEGE